MNSKLLLATLVLALVPVLNATQSAPVISGDYLEVRSCDVYTGPCFANAEMGLTGKEAIMVWSVRKGAWQGTALDNLKVIAVVSSDGTLGDLHYQPRSGKAVLIVDSKANTDQREALVSMARSMSGKLIREIVEVKTTSIEAKMGACTESGCASVKAGNLVSIATRCLGNNDHLCGNEEVYYPPLSLVNGAIPAFTELAAFKGHGLNVTWEMSGQRSAFLAAFSR